MQTYYGVVRGNVVVLPEGVHLADGSTVEVRVPDLSSSRATDEAARETLFMQDLMEAGLVLNPPYLDADLPSIERRLIQVQGTPLSQMIIEERR